MDEIVREQCSGAALPFSDLGEVTLRGFDRPVKAYEVQWTKTQD
jgi:class 3 adenylate cyclase